MIQLYRGSIFDSKCDLIVIPCNTMGGISTAIYNELLAHGLPTPNMEVRTNGISFVETVNSFTSASVIAYAASVGVRISTSNETLVRHIAHRIKQYCHENSLRKVNVPLLGTGAGGLSAELSYSILEKIFASDSRITLCVYAFSDSAYQALANRRHATVAASRASIKNPRVFISYTGTNLEHRNWVRNFACRLRDNGVDARIDMFHLRPGQDLHQWMTNEVIMADKVLLICDKFYAEKADTRRSGVGWETMIILGDMLSSQDQTKYIGIIRDKDIDESLPVYVRSKYSLNWADDAQVEKEFNDLILYLFDCDIEPPIGNIPDFVIKKLNN